MSLKKIMAVLDPTLTMQPAFERALDSAEITGATLHLYLCVSDENGEGGRETIVAERQAGLESLAERARDRNIEVECEVDWNEDWRSQVVAASRRSGADLVIKHSVDHSDVDRAKRNTADWMLLRETHCPVLMTKDHTRWEDRRILAAVVDKPVDAAHAQLNDHVIAFANDFADSYQSDAHFVAAFHDLNHPPDAVGLAGRCSAEPGKVHVVHGQTDRVIADTAKDIGADLIIIGTVGRTGIKATVVGNTSERLLDHTHCDVLVLH